MKTLFKYLLVFFVLAAAAGLIYWQANKKSILKDTIQNTVNKKTDSLYYLHYDSSRIDELTGTAAFYNVSLQSDSAQKELLKRTDSLPNAIFNIKAKEVSASGINIPGLLTQQTVAAGKILIHKPFIQIINTGREKPKLYTQEDTLALYQKILGRFKSIQTDTIQIIDGTVILSDISGKPLTTLEKINITLKNFLVDSTRNYENIISYFIKDIRLSIDNIQLPPSSNNTRINIGQLEYDAAKKTLKAGELQQYKINDINPQIDLKNIYLHGLSTDSFILYHQLKTAGISCDGGVVTIYRKQKKERNNDSTLQLSSELIDGIETGTVQLGNTKVILLDEARPGDPPFILDGVRFNVSKVLKVTNGSTLGDLINNAEWKLQVAAFSFMSKEKKYKAAAADIEMDNTRSVMTVKRFSLTPQLSESAFMKQEKYQTDRYDFAFNNITATNINFKKLLNENKLEIETASLQPVLKIYNDRTLPPDPHVVQKKFPQQSLLELKTKFSITKIIVNNGYVEYKERGGKSAFTGTIAFHNINATINNVTNMPEKIKLNPNAKLTAKTKFLNKTNLYTEWCLPLTAADSTFTIIGQMEGMPAVDLNPVVEPLAMASIKKGTINNLKFNLLGSNYGTKGEVIFLYNDLNIEVLKKNDENELEKKDLATFLANIIIKNNNPQNGDTRTGKIDLERDIKRSFFNLVWKSIFTGVKKTAAK
ncbi:MAG: hypothetical protein QM791_17660 [Ferruginibacter sp.]